MLLTRLPLAPARVLTPLVGPRWQVDHAFRALHEAWLVDAVRPRLGRSRCERLWYLTDLGLGAVALDQGVDPRSLADRQRLRGAQLAQRLAGVERHLRVYELLAALAASFPEPPELLAWEQPWRRRVVMPRWNSLVRVVLPAYVALGAADGRACACLLLPDQTETPVEAHRTTLVRLAALAARDRTVPCLLVAVADARRADDWRRLIDDVASARGLLPAVTVVQWCDLFGGGWSAAVACPASAPPPALVRRVRLRSLGQHVRAGRGLRRLVGPDPTATWDQVHLGGSPGLAALRLDPSERALLRWIARLPFLSSEALHLAVNDRPGTTRRRVDRLCALGLVRVVGPDEVGPVAARAVLVEATRAGLDVVAAEMGPTRLRAYRVHGLVGGGPATPVGNRARLLGCLRHTLGVNAFVIALCRAAHDRRGVGDALVGWWNEAACADGALKPDGLGAFRRDGRQHLFFLELDRGTARATQYRTKFTTYREHRDRGRLARRYGGVPTVLFVTATAEAELGAARVLRSLARRDEPLPVLLTTWRRIREDPDGPLGPVWRTAASDDRTAWLPDAI
jgi:hypothetical protein